MVSLRQATSDYLNQCWHLMGILYQWSHNNARPMKCVLFCYVINFLWIHMIYLYHTLEVCSIDTVSNASFFQCQQNHTERFGWKLPISSQSLCNHFQWYYDNIVECPENMVPRIIYLSIYERCAQAYILHSDKSLQSLSILSIRYKIISWELCVQPYGYTFFAFDMKKSYQPGDISDAPKLVEIV